MRVRDDDKIRTKKSVALDAHQLGYVVFGGLVVAGLVFAAGFAVGQEYAPPARPQAIAEVACLEVLDEAGPAAASAVSMPMPDLHYEERLKTPVPPAAPDDPALRLLAEEREDLALPGVEPALPEEPPEDSPFGDPAVLDEAEPAVAVAPPAAPERRRSDRARSERPERSRGKFTLQVQAFRDRAQADAFVAQLQAHGHSAFVQESNIRGKGRWYRVRVGRFANQKEALAFQTQFESSEGIDTFVTALR